MAETTLVPLKEIMHAISSGLLMPTIAVFLFLLALSVIELGGLKVEALAERRQMKVNVSEMLDSFQDKQISEIAAQIEDSRLFRRQKAAIKELINHRDLPAASLQARTPPVGGEELHYVRITNRTDLLPAWVHVRLDGYLNSIGTGADCFG